MKVFCYILGSSKNPDRVECAIPYKIDEESIFFGPCMKLLRRRLYREYLQNLDDGECDVSNEELYIVGFNGLNNERVRKIVWVGKIIKIMTFERAYNLMTDEEHKEKYKEMLDHPYSPLHVMPIYENNMFVGYKLRSKEHAEKNQWIKDIIDNYENNPDIIIENDYLKLKDPSKRKEVFIQDACFLCDNIFFAVKSGMEIDDKILNILKKARQRNDIDEVCIFGRDKNGNCIALRNYLEIEGELAKKLIEYIKEKSNDIDNNGPWKPKLLCKPLK
ncbi:hypothetical protein [Methanocaldococcus sp.]